MEKWSSSLKMDQRKQYTQRNNIMKLTCTPTDQKQIEEYLKKGDPTLLNPTVSIEHPMDDMTLPDFMTQVIFPMLVGMGYCQSSIARTITIDDDNNGYSDNEEYEEQDLNY